MKLFLNTKNQPALFFPESFAGLLLQRLYIMEAVAASKYKKEEKANPGSALIALIETKCAQREYNATQTACIVAIFKEVIQLSQLIQTACIAEWEGKSEDTETVRERGLASAQTILPPFEDQSQAIRAYLSPFTDKIMDSLAYPDMTSDLNRLEACLIQCYPGIDQARLKKSIESIDTQMDAIDILEETSSQTSSPLRNLSLFESKIPPNSPAKAPSYCSIS
ncbi:MAG TPA: hypothetical protein DDY37_00985 [Legionella sp.]|nr:hypothetical protein [Legionella sp.]